MFEDPQDDSESIHCRHLNLEDGRCGIHGVHPFSCDFELIRFTHHLDRVYVGTRFYGRSWNMLRIDGSRGALCTLTPTADVESVVRRLKRLKKWAEYFEIESCVDKIISYAETGPHSKELMIPVRSNSGFLS